MKPKYIIIAGVNGAGKSTLYSISPNLFAGTKRLNADEYLKASGGDWRLAADNAKAMKKLVKELNQAIDQRESIHQETTLAGTGKPFLKLIKKAHEKGYEVTLIYVFLNHVDIAIERVASRVVKGGHGVDEGVIRRRYDSSLENFLSLSPMVDCVKLYDNTRQFRLLYHREHGEQIFIDEQAMAYFPSLLSGK